ncbi:lipopolysaccharide heptosyltransferase RfaC [Rodentibacter caecimuris]|uniref:Lipopolysaccharide heptosyltransferase 1 n=1 Tax=Rodentibacter caecimuris TaxID=1796644 RepID=A0ABX3KZB9_9PAST|nr:lipopolysaccharide heptosyltransferase 1 [Rodentibacter heylii]
MKICLIKTSSMGDVIHSLPALTDAQLAISDLQVDWVVEENFAEIPRWHHAVNQVIPIALRRWRKLPFSSQTQQEWKIYRNLLQQNQYDAVIDAQGLIKSALFATRLVKGVKHGYDCHSIREPLASFFYQKKYAIPYQQHAVERIRQLFAKSLGYNLPKTVGNYYIVDHFQRVFMPESTNVPYVLFIHATTRADKHWVNDEWRNLAQKLTALGYQIRLPWGNEKEKQRAEWIATGIQSAVVLPQLSLTELARQLVHCSAVVSVDTGLAHLTAALDKPNITLYGATDPNLIGTYGKHQHHLCATTLKDITTEQVWTKLNPILNAQ